jgi:hypothetical protein
MSDARKSIESAATGSPVTASDGMRRPLSSDVPSPAAVNADPDGGPTHTSDHATETRAPQVSFHESNTTSVNDYPIQGGSQRYLADQQPLRPWRSKPTAFPEALVPCR